MVAERRNPDAVETAIILGLGMVGLALFAKRMITDPGKMASDAAGWAGNTVLDTALNLLPTKPRGDVEYGNVVCSIEYVQDTQHPWMLGSINLNRSLGLVCRDKATGTVVGTWSPTMGWLGDWPAGYSSVGGGGGSRGAG